MTDDGIILEFRKKTIGDDIVEKEKLIVANGKEIEQYE